MPSRLVFPADNQRGELLSDYRQSSTCTLSKYSLPESYPPTPTRANGPTKSKETVIIWAWTILPLASHLIFVGGTTLLMLFGIDGRRFSLPDGKRQLEQRERDGDMAVSITSASLLQSDVTTIISILLVIIRLLVTVWLADLVWKLMLILLEKCGLSVREMDRLQTWKVPPIRTHKRNSWHYTFLVGLVLILHLPAQIGSPILTGSVNWEPKDKPFLDVPLMDIPTFRSDSIAWSAYQANPSTRFGVVIDAARISELGWASSPNAPEYEVRRYVAVAAQRELRDGSIIHNITLPYMAFTNFRWISDPTTIPNETFEGIQMYSPLTKITGDGLNPLYYYPVIGNVALIPTRPWTPQGASPQRRDLANGVRMYESPPSLKYVNDDAYIAVLVGTQDNYGSCDTIQRSALFGKFPKNVGLYSFILPPDRNSLDQEGPGRACFIFAAVHIEAGVTTCEKCSLTGSKLVARNFSEYTTVIKEDPLVYEALSLVPHVTNAITMMNVSLPRTTDDMEKYIKQVISRSYTSAWNSLTDMTFTPGKGLTSGIDKAVPMLRARVDRLRLYIWVGTQALVWVAAVMFIILQSHSRSITTDTSIMAIFLNTSRLDGRTMSSLSNERKISKEHDRLGPLHLTEELGAGRPQWYLQAVRDSH